MKKIKNLKIAKIETEVYILQTLKKQQKIRKYCEKLYINKLEKVVKMDRFLEKYKLSELTQWEGGSWGKEYMYTDSWFTLLYSRK